MKVDHHPQTKKKPVLFRNQGSKEQWLCNSMVESPPSPE